MLSISVACFLSCVPISIAWSVCLCVCLSMIFNDRTVCFFLFAGEPQEECVRCGKMYILSGDLNKGACGKCLGIVPSRDQLKSTPFRSSGESSGTEEEIDDEEELSNDIP